MKPPAFPLKVFYDGSCYVCSSEMDLYRKDVPEGVLEFVDITGEGFEPDKYGRTKEQFMEQIHALDAEGRMYEGVDALWAIWRAFPSYSFYGMLGAFVSNPLVNPFVRFAYRCFASFRGSLPGRPPKNTS